MIAELLIRGLGVIEEATCCFSPQFTAVTGETGAGKTMIITGLGLLHGARADQGLVRVGAQRAEVEGRFDLDPDNGAIPLILEAGGDVDEDGLVVARIVGATGRGRRVLGGRTVPATVLGEAMAKLLVIHGQHDQSRLAGGQLELLDRFAQCGALRSEFADAYAIYRQRSRELANLTAARTARERELEMLTYSLAEIAQIDPVVGEDAELAAESARLSHADALAEAAQVARAAISGQEGIYDTSDALTELHNARKALDGVRMHDGELDQLWVRLGDAASIVADVSGDLASYVAALDEDPRRLAAVEARRAELTGLIRKHGSSLADVLTWAADASGRAATLAQTDDQIEALESSLVRLRHDLGELGMRLRHVRVAGAARFAEAVQSELTGLAMPRASVAFAVELRPDPHGLAVPSLAADGPIAVTASGFDHVELMMSAHPGAPLRPVGSAASGGELSRIMLAIHVVLADSDPVPTMIFDEIDAGVGGEAAIEIGTRLARLAQFRQVIVVTHLAQVAAFADRQVVVAKSVAGAVTSSSLQVVTGTQRVTELARMLGGLADSKSGAEHAQELLDLAASRRGAMPGVISATLGSG